MLKLISRKLQRSLQFLIMCAHGQQLQVSQNEGDKFSFEIIFLNTQGNTGKNMIFIIMIL